MTPTQARSIGTNLTPCIASEASRARTMTTRSPGPAWTTSAATCTRPTGSSRLLRGWTVSSLTPPRSGYLRVQTAEPRMRPSSTSLHPLDDVRHHGVEQLSIHLVAQAGDDGGLDAVDEL